MKLFLFFIISLVGLIGQCSGTADLINEWNNFKLTYGKSYPAGEELYRKLVYLTNRIWVDTNNAIYPNRPFQVGINQFADLTLWEYQQIFSRYQTITPAAASTTTNTGPAPQASVDWRSFGAVSPVQDQGTSCNHGWAFAANAALEGQTFTSQGALNPTAFPINLSEQNLIDCAGRVSATCSIGTTITASNFVTRNQNVNLESAYPNQVNGLAGQYCNYDPNNFGATQIGQNVIPTGDETEIANIVDSLGPVAVSIDPTQQTFQFYKSGVYNDAACSSNTLYQRHFLTIVGYSTDTTSGLQYWIAKNSFGTTWGEAGYIRIARNNNNRCGVATYATYPLV